MKISLILVAISIVLLGAFFAVVEWQEDECYGYRGKIVTRPFFSHYVDDMYKIVVYLPKSYDPKDAKRYPVIYQLDGNYYGKTTAILMANFNCKGVVSNEAIVVGIGYYYDGWFDKRERDYIYAGSVIREAITGENRTNKGLHFYYFLRNELIPYVDAHFKTDNRKFGRTLMGHSLGGYFTLFAMFYDYYVMAMDTNVDSPLFTNFIAASPVVVNEWRYLFILEEKLKRWGFGSFSVSLFMATSDIEEKTTIKYFPVMANHLQRWNLPGFRLKSQTLKKLQHPETAIPAYMSGLTFVFNP
jgi:uncharacterized protein